MSYRVGNMKITTTEKICLKLLVDAYDSPEHCVLFFKHFTTKTDLTLTQVRRAVRGLARKGLAEYTRCFDCDEGRVMGSGYMATMAGQSLAEATQTIG